MSIKNDRWIRRQAQESGMIEPFRGRPGALGRWAEDRQLWHQQLWL